MLLDKFNATIRVNESKGKVKVYKAWMNDRTVFALSSKNLMIKISITKTGVTIKRILSRSKKS